MTKDEVIDKCLDYLYKATTHRRFDELLKPYKLDAGDYKIVQDRLLNSEKLIEWQGMAVVLTTRAIEIIKNGGYLKHIGKYTERQQKIEQKEQLDIELVKSTIEANKLNQRNEGKNKTFTIINIAVGILNAILLAVQIYLLVRPSK